MRAVLVAAIVAIATPAFAQPAPEPNSFDAEGWVADLRQTREAMGSHYANLEWALTEREAPLDQMFTLGEQRLRAARSDAEARAVFDQLEQYLGDGHVEFVWPNAGSGGGASGGGADEQSPCEALGYGAPGGDRHAIATRLPGYRPLEGESGFPAGIVEVDGHKVGVIRIAQLSPQVHPNACAAALAASSRPAGEPCDDDCLQALSLLAVDNVTDDFSARLRALRDAGAETLLVDLAANGGGTEWVEVLARVVTPVRVRSARVGYVRHPHWVASLADSEERMRDLAEASPADRARLEGYGAVFAQARQEAATPCDATALLAGRAGECDWLTTAPLYSTGPVAELDPSLVGKPWAGEVFGPLRHLFEPGVWTGPLMVLVDGNTASASEELAAVLQDNGAAVIVGAPTFGAGCGHANGEIRTVLAHSGARLRLPNCARLRADGTNEVSGIDPDVLIGFRGNDGPTRRARRLQEALPAAIEAARRLADERGAPTAS